MVAFDLTRAVPVVHRAENGFGDFAGSNGFVEFATRSPSVSVFFIGFTHCGFALITLPVFTLFFLTMVGLFIFLYTVFSILFCLFYFLIGVWGDSPNGRRLVEFFSCMVVFTPFTAIGETPFRLLVCFFSGFYRWFGTVFPCGGGTTRFASGRVTKFAVCVSTEESQGFGLFAGATCPSNLFVGHGRFLSRLHPSQPDPTKNGQPGWSVDYQRDRRTQDDSIKNNFISQAFYALHTTERYAIPVYRH